MTDLQATSPMMEPAYAPPKLPVAHAAGATWRVFRQRPWRFVLLTILPVVVTVFVALLPALVRTSMSEGIKVVDQVLITVVQYGVQFTCQNAIIYGGARVMSGQSFGIGEAIGVGLRRLLPYLGAFVLSVIVFLVGFIVFVIPGIIAIVYLMLAAPACVIERRGPIASLDRSVRLIRGNWWRVVGVIFLALILPLLGVGVVTGLAAAALSPVHAAVWAFLLLVPIYPVFFAVVTLMGAVLFLELRSLKEGGPREAVAAVFD